MFGIKIGIDWERECEILTARITEQEETIIKLKCKSNKLK